MHKLSIIVPVYNAKKYLKKCIDSILKQTYTDFELILIDDGSTDNSGEICDEYAKANSNIRVIHKENEGLVAARKTGLQNALGEYIGFVDSDDYIDEGMYETLMKPIEKNNADISIGGLVSVNENGVLNELFNKFAEGFYDKKRMTEEVFPKMLYHSGFINYGIIPGVVVKVFKKSVLEKGIAKVDNRIKMGEDGAITFNTIFYAKSIYFVDSAQYYYVQHAESMIHKYNPKRMEEFMFLYDCLYSIEDKEFKKQLDNFFAYLFVYAITDCILADGLDEKQKKAEIKTILTNKRVKKAIKSAKLKDVCLKHQVKLLLVKMRCIGILIKLFSARGN